MKQIDQDPGSYRVQRPDGYWTQRVDRRLCRGMALLGTGLITWLGVSFVQEGGSASIVAAFSLIGAAVGGLFVLSLRSTDW